MKRTVPIEIAGKTYPLRQTLHVTEWMYEKFGNLQDMLKTMVTEATSVSALLDIMAELMKQGAAYENKFGDPEEDWTRGEDGQVLFLSREDLGLICDDTYLADFINKILEAYDLAVAEEIKAVETPETKKSKKK